jgi:hypothetical protein
MPLRPYKPTPRPTLWGAALLHEWMPGDAGNTGHVTGHGRVKARR